MKRADLMKQLGKIARERGEKLEVVEGGNHTKIRIGGRLTVVPRHREISEGTARGIIRKMSVIQGEE